MTILIPISPGELLDKISVLEIKSERIQDKTKCDNIRYELDRLLKARDKALSPSPELDRLYAGLKKANEKLWNIEDDIRDCERQKAFGKHFIELARAVYRTNDARSELKKSINQHLGSKIMEEKSYTPYE